MTSSTSLGEMLMATQNLKIVLGKILQIEITNKNIILSSWLVDTFLLSVEIYFDNFSSLNFYYLSILTKYWHLDELGFIKYWYLDELGFLVRGSSMMDLVVRAL